MDALAVLRKSDNLLALEPAIDGLLTRVESLDDLADMECQSGVIHDMLSGLAKNLRMQNAACVIRVKILRRIGQLLPESSKKSQADAAVSRNVRRNARAIARIPQEEFLEHCNLDAVCEQGLELTLKDFLKVSRRVSSGVAVGGGLVAEDEDRDESTECSSTGKVALPKGDSNSEPADCDSSSAAVLVPEPDELLDAYRVLWVDPPWSLPGARGKKPDEDAIVGDQLVDWFRMRDKRWDNNCVLFVSCPNEFLHDVFDLIDEFHLRYYLTIVSQRYAHTKTTGTDHSCSFLVIAYRGKFTPRTRRFGCSVVDEAELITKITSGPRLKLSGAMEEGFHLVI